MAEKCETPVSDDLRDRLVRIWNALADGKKIAAFRLGERPGQVIVHTAEGLVPMTITENGATVYFRMPSGTTDRKAPKDMLLADLAEKEHRLFPPPRQESMATGVLDSGK